MLLFFNSYRMLILTFKSGEQLIKLMSTKRKTFKARKISIVYSICQISYFFWQVVAMLILVKGVFIKKFVSHCQFWCYRL